MIKKAYTSPEVEIEKFTVFNVYTTSVDDGGVDTEDNEVDLF
jgi:hypothetical protein